MLVKEDYYGLSVTLKDGEKIEVLSESGEHFLVLCIDDKIVIKEVNSD